jgi:hypothetical protein
MGLRQTRPLGAPAPRAISSLQDWRHQIDAAAEGLRDGLAICTRCSGVSGREHASARGRCGGGAARRAHPRRRRRTPGPPRASPWPPGPGPPRCPAHAQHPNNRTQSLRRPAQTVVRGRTRRGLTSARMAGGARHVSRKVAPWAGTGRPRCSNAPCSPIPLLRTDNRPGDSCTRSAGRRTHARSVSVSGAPTHTHARATTTGGPARVAGSSSDQRAGGPHSPPPRP